jgi:hypothetical protein
MIGFEEFKNEILSIYKDNLLFNHEINDHKITDEYLLNIMYKYFNKYEYLKEDIPNEEDMYTVYLRALINIRNKNKNNNNKEIIKENQQKYYKKYKDKLVICKYCGKDNIKYYNLCVHKRSCYEYQKFKLGVHENS